jgi:hypothetical protein
MFPNFQRNNTLANLHPTNAYAGYQPDNPAHRCLASITPAQRAAAPQPTTASVQSNASLMTPTMTPKIATFDLPTASPITPTKRKAESQGQRQQESQPSQGAPCTKTSNDKAGDQPTLKFDGTYQRDRHSLRLDLDRKFESIEKSVDDLKKDTKTSLDNIVKSIDEIKNAFHNDPFAG